MPLLELGHDVSGCDLSAAMVAAARARTAGRARIVQADLLTMPLLGRFDLVTCFGDVPNHLGSLEEVRTALTGLRRNLRHGGMLLFDVNLLAAYRDVPDVTVRDDDRIVTWWGSRAQIREPGGSGEVVIDVFQRGEDRLWHRSTCRQPHRHHPLPGVLDAVSAAGLEVLGGPRARARRRAPARGGRVAAPQGRGAGPPAGSVPQDHEEGSMIWRI